MNQSLSSYAAGIMPAYLLSGLPRSLCTIQAPANDAGVPTIGDLGVPDGTYANIAGLVDIVCQDAPEGFGGSLQSKEIKTPSSVSSIERRHVLLAGWYPQIAQESNWGTIGWRASITGPDNASLVYDIIGAESDSQGIMTRLSLQRETV